KPAFILPNHKNILMASEQASNIVDVDTVAIPTKSILQGITALFQYDEESSLEDNKNHIETALEAVQSGSVTYAVRGTKIDGIEIKKDEFMGLAEDKIVTSDADQLTAVKG
ncbi:hypothetical protein KW811_22925, partial [Enterobacter quasiroggenkampii]|nr:hypothetical protein [Enterobacter quasiroggenkampii]